MTQPTFSVSEAQIEEYRANGFVQIPGIITPAEAAEFRAVALNLSRRAKSLAHGHQYTVFDQLVNVWREDADIRRLTFHPHVSAAARQLAGVPLRLWHDQTLIKQPHAGVATEFHQDRPYWPHGNSPNPITAWIALVDVPVERGCMSSSPAHFAAPTSRHRI